MAVSREEVRRVAELARLALEPDEVDRLALELSAILDHVDALQAVGGDEEGGEEAPTGAVERAPLRADEPTADPLAVEPAELAPEWVDGYYVVPRLSSHAGSPPRPDAGAGEGP